MNWDTAYRKTTDGIEIYVLPAFLSDQSDPDDDLYVWAYHIRICNNSNETVTLRQRCWHITDAAGLTETVRGEGVVGEQPTLEPGETYEYSSGTPLSTPSGIMLGSYDMETEEGEWLSIDIPAFSLDSPHESAPVN